MTEYRKVVPYFQERHFAPAPLLFSHFTLFNQGTTRLWERQWVASGTVMLRRWVRLDQRAGGERAAGEDVLQPLLFPHLLQCARSRYPCIPNTPYAELIAAPWPGEREIFSFGNMASRSSARIENLPLTRNVAAKLSAPEADKEDARSFEASKGKNSRHSLGDKMRAGGSENGGKGDVEREVRVPSAA